jgi:hypothetical protein
VCSLPHVVFTVALASLSLASVFFSWAALLGRLVSQRARADTPRPLRPGSYFSWVWSAMVWLASRRSRRSRRQGPCSLSARFGAVSPRGFHDPFPRIARACGSCLIARYWSSSLFCVTPVFPARVWATPRSSVASSSPLLKPWRRASPSATPRRPAASVARPGTRRSLAAQVKSLRRQLSLLSREAGDCARSERSFANHQN